MDEERFWYKWRGWIWNCIRSVNYSILVNGRPRGKILASRGLRQGDPLSPFLFILVVDILSRLISVGVEKEALEAFEVEREKACLSHLQFADNTLLFCSGNFRAFENLNGLLGFFEAISGLKINRGKSSLLGINCEDGKLSEWATLFQKCLSSWKKAFFSKGGRLTLIQSVLRGIPNYYLSLFRIPVKVIEGLEKIMRDFLWEGVEEGGGAHLVNWKEVSKPLEAGGLGVGNLRLRNEAFLAKWLWRFFHEPHALWRKIIVSKYERHPSDWILAGGSKVSNFNPWKAIASCFPVFSLSLRVSVGDGLNAYFWEDTWLGNKPLSLAFPRIYFLSEKKLLSVAEVLNFGEEDSSISLGLSRSLTDPESLEIAALLDLLPSVSCSSGREDVRVWIPNPLGGFSCSSFFQVLISPSSSSFLASLSSSSSPSLVTPWFTSLWKIKIPKKIKFFGWQRLQGDDGGSVVIPPFRNRGRFLWQACFLASLWGIWLERNNRLFRGVEKSVDSDTENNHIHHSKSAFHSKDGWSKTLEAPLTMPILEPHTP
ncbi:uncharacterized protein LOC111019624 [Momordica charantia]|uniref:Uncharacterized protein LOC111019624 n=1 Tax=Momordica charantia TaxID=3673 RepID=A0A6J1DFI2_MOMCH|nr:uncharacterized protein LOC111019624 [Momordica charantia]